MNNRFVLSLSLIKLFVVYMFELLLFRYSVMCVLMKCLFWYAILGISVCVGVVSVMVVTFLDE